MKIIKRNGQTEDFNEEKIFEAVLKAASEVYAIDDVLREKLAKLAISVKAELEAQNIENLNISMIQALVEKKLLEASLVNIAERYISYRLQQDLERVGLSKEYTAKVHFVLAEKEE